MLLERLPGHVKAGILCCLLLFSMATHADLGRFDQVETSTLADQDFVFPDDLNAPQLNIVLLAIGEDKDNGAWQGEALLDWYAALERSGVLSDGVRAWHFSVLKVPFFIKGLIRGGMADDYKEKVPLDQAAPLFIKDVPGFAKRAGIALDGQPTIVLVKPDGTLVQAFKGEATDEAVADVVAAVATLTGGG